MIDFQTIQAEQKEAYEEHLAEYSGRGCEYSFANLFLWGRQKMAFVGDMVLFFSQFSRKSVYLFPLCAGKIKEAVDLLIHDAQKRGIPCRLTGLTAEDCRALAQVYPGKFRFHTDRDSFDYVYEIDQLCSLAGRKYQRKRNHLNRFYQTHSDVRTEPVTRENLAVVENLAQQWYTQRLQEDDTQDFHMEKAALSKVLSHMEELGMEGLLLWADGQPAAFTLGSRLSEDTFDVHFEKALERYDGAYPAINKAFACYLHEKYPELKKLNREDDMGIEGLRKAKLSYNPAHLQEKYWACLLEDGYDY